MTFSAASRRRESVKVEIGPATIGGGAPIAVQSMTNTDTADVGATAEQVLELAAAGSELVRITVDRPEAAAAVPHIRDRIAARGVRVPLIGDFHYNGHLLLAQHPAAAEALDKYRINPGNVGFREKKDRNFGTLIELALRHDKPVRIGVNWGSLDQALLTDLMDANAKAAEPLSARAVLHEAVVQSALASAERARQLGLGENRIVLSAKVSEVQDLIAVYRSLARRWRIRCISGSPRPGWARRVSSPRRRRLAVLLQEGIGDTIRISLTPEPGGDRRREVIVAQEILQTHGPARLRTDGDRLPGLRAHDVDGVPGARKRYQRFRRARRNAWRQAYPGFERLQLAVMGCIVNGPGESKHADIGISLPGTGEIPAAPVFIDGKKTKCCAATTSPRRSRRSSRTTWRSAGARGKARSA